MKGAKKVAGLIGDLAPTEAAFSLKQLVEALGGSVECRTDGAKLPIGNRSGYVGTASIADIDGAKMIQLIGTDPRSEAPARTRGSVPLGPRAPRSGWSARRSI